MSNSKSSYLTLPYRLEQTLGQVNVMALNPHQQFELLEQVPLLAIPEHLDSGKWDEAPSLALRLSAEYLLAGENNIIPLNHAHQMLIYRWFVAYAFIEHQSRLMGEPVYVYSNGKDTVSAALSLNVTRLAMANNIEDALIGKFGYEQGVKDTITFYSNMLAMEKSNPIKLSEFGIEAMKELHDLALSEFLSNGGVIKGIKYDA